MARQSITTQGSTAIGPSLLGIAFVGFAADLQDKAAVAICRMVCAMASELLQTLPSLLLATLRALDSLALDHSPVFVCAQFLISAAALLHSLVGLV